MAPRIFMDSDHATLGRFILADTSVPSPTDPETFKGVFICAQ